VDVNLRGLDLGEDDFLKPSAGTDSTRDFLYDSFVIIFVTFISSISFGRVLLHEHVLLLWESGRIIGPSNPMHPPG